MNVFIAHVNKVQNCFTGPRSEEVMVETFIENQDVVVTALNDDSFEHLTQAATGATTGDWFVYL